MQPIYVIFTQYHMDILKEKRATQSGLWQLLQENTSVK